MSHKGRRHALKKKKNSIWKKKEYTPNIATFSAPRSFFKEKYCLNKILWEAKFRKGNS